MTSFLLLVKVSWRNVWRNPRGTLLTALALGLGLALLLISLGLLDGGHEQTIANGVRFGPGDVVIQPKGFQATGSQELLLPARVVSTIKEFLQTESMKRVLVGASPRLLATGLLSSAANSASVTITGVIPREERAVSLIPQRMIEGQYLSDDKPTGIVIGADMARKLEVGTGSKVVLMTQAVRQPGTKVKDVTGGEMQSTLLRVNGIFRTGIEMIDADVIQLPLPLAQTLLGVSDNQVTQVALFLRQEGDSLMVAKALRKRLEGDPVEILTWRESMPMLAQILGLDHAFNYVMNGVVLAMVGLGILNTILMRVLERRYEFGVCKALGLRPGQLAMMIIGESLALTAISLAFGLALGLSVEHYFATSGLDLRVVFRTGLPRALVVDPILYSRLSPARIVSSVIIVFIMATVISFYPALKAARTELPDALKVL
ncbi:MAG TPA: FtsX-like permease family protein [Candidatus Binataceae bacterium]|nr:FtsX-like permease family protein [Candidatus Binataceae bacterium]